MAERTLRTIVYIDGFNFYYGTIRGTPWKWLDLQTFFGKLLAPRNQLVGIKYFTAKIQPTSRDPDAHTRQDAYLRALSAHCPLVQLHYGHFLRHPVWMECVTPPPPRAQVYRTEEKGSDVNLAIHLLNDAWQDAYDCAVVVSNDSDLAEALRLVKLLPAKLIGLVTPGAPGRHTSRQLAMHSDFVRRIRTWMLSSSQLPNPVPQNGARKPKGW